MAKYYIQVKKASDGRYQYVRDVSGKIRGFNSISDARRSLMIAIESGKYGFSELGMVEGNKVGEVNTYTYGVVRKIIARGSKSFVWDDYTTGKKNKLNKDGTLGARYEGKNIAGYPNVKYPGWDY